MSDYYTEQLVKKKSNKKDALIKILLIAATIASAFIVFIFPFGIILPVIMIGLDVYMFQNLDVEYEYLYVNGELDIDKIMHKARRKRIFTMTVHDLEVLAPLDAGELRQYQRAKTYDYSSGNGNAELFAVVVTQGGKQKKVILEPNETIRDGFYFLAPRKVVRN